MIKSLPRHWNIRYMTRTPVNYCNKDKKQNTELLQLQTNLPSPAGFGVWAYRRCARNRILSLDLANSDHSSAICALYSALIMQNLTSEWGSSML